MVDGALPRIGRPLTAHAVCTTFETALGVCGIAWSDAGILGIQLPEHTPAKTRARLVTRFAGTPSTVIPASVERAIADIVRLLDGESVTLSTIALDMSGVPPFYRRVYDVARAIPPGRTMTYGEVAAKMGAPGSARAVGQALGRNPFAIVVPCHRVVAAGGRSGGFSAPGGVSTKRRMLAIEGAASVGTAAFDF